MPERLGPSNTGEGISQNGFNDIERPQRESPVGLHEVAEIFQELWVEYSVR